MTDQHGALASLWEWFAEAQFSGYSPLYARIARAVAGDASVLELAAAAPPEAHLPINLLAAVHYLLLDQVGHPLAEVFAGHSNADPAPLFLEFCRDQRDELLEVLETRRIQTNECGRSAFVGPGLSWIAARHGEPLALVDVGASGGLNLLCDHYLLDYGPHGTTGPTQSPVAIECAVRAGAPPIAASLPPIAERIGIDRSPLDLTDPDDARWLLACVWPDTGRLERTAAAIALAQAAPTTVLRGDGNEMVADVLASLPADAHPVVLTTFAFAYFSHEDRQRFVESLRTVSRERPITWLSAEGAGTVASLTGDSTEVPADQDLLGAVTFQGGGEEGTVLARVQSHGLWLEWRAD